MLNYGIVASVTSPLRSLHKNCQANLFLQSMFTQARTCWDMLGPFLDHMHRIRCARNMQG